MKRAKVVAAAAAAARWSFIRTLHKLRCAGTAYVVDATAQPCTSSARGMHSWGCPSLSRAGFERNSKADGRAPTAAMRPQSDARDATRRRQNLASGL